MDAILSATIQVLLQAGRERLTTTRVAARAGVSVGTLYQYFPNKSALLQAVLRRHLDEVTCAVEAACEAHGGKTLREMAEALVTAFLQAKLKDVRTSTALYFISSGVDVASILAEMRTRSERAIVQMLESAADPPTKDPRLLCFMLQGAMAGVSRAILESHAPERQFEAYRQELIALICNYLVG